MDLLSEFLEKVEKLSPSVCIAVIAILALFVVLKALGVAEKSLDKRQ